MLSTYHAVVAGAAVATHGEPQLARCHPEPRRPPVRSTCEVHPAAEHRPAVGAAEARLTGERVGVPAGVSEFDGFGALKVYAAAGIGGERSAVDASWTLPPSTAVLGGDVVVELHRGVGHVAGTTMSPTGQEVDAARCPRRAVATVAGSGAGPLATCRCGRPGASVASHGKVGAAARDVSGGRRPAGEPVLEVLGEHRRAGRARTTGERRVVRVDTAARTRTGRSGRAAARPPRRPWSTWAQSAA